MIMATLFLIGQMTLLILIVIVGEKQIGPLMGIE